MEIQQYQDEYKIRIKVASIGPDGNLVYDCYDEYANLFDQLPPGWQAQEMGAVHTPSGSSHRAWVVEGQSEKVVVTEHESGAEILIAVATGIAIRLISPALSNLAKHLWKQWGTSRESSVKSGQKIESSLVIETVEERFPNGGAKLTRRLELRAPISESEIESAFARLST